MLRACTLQNGAVAVVFYFLSVIISLSIANIDDKINLSQDADRLLTLWDNDQVSRIFYCSNTFFLAKRVVVNSIKYNLNNIQITFITWQTSKSTSFNAHLRSFCRPCRGFKSAKVEIEPMKSESITVHSIVMNVKFVIFCSTVLERHDVFSCVTSSLNK